MAMTMRVMILREIQVNPLTPLRSQLEALLGPSLEKVRVMKQELSGTEETLDSLLRKQLEGGELDKDALLRDIPSIDTENDILLVQSGPFSFSSKSPELPPLSPRGTPRSISRRMTTAGEDPRPSPEVPKLVPTKSSSRSRPISVMTPKTSKPNNKRWTIHHNISEEGEDAEDVAAPSISPTPSSTSFTATSSTSSSTTGTITGITTTSTGTSTSTTTTTTTGTGTTGTISTFPSSSGDDGGLLASQPQMKKWKQRQQMHAQLKADARNRRIFGVPLEELLIRPTTYSVLETGSGEALVPPVIVSLVNHIRANGTRVEGLFRLAGNHASIQEMKRLMDSGDTIAWATYDIHSVANLLKVFLRELPEPLFTFRFFDRWMNAIKFSPASEASSEASNLRMDYILALLSSLPRPNKNLLRYLFSFLNELAINTSETTKMNAHNLAVVLGPNLIQPGVQPSEPVAMMTLQSNIIDLVEIFIELTDTLFGDLDTVPPFTTYRSLNSHIPQSPDELDIQINDIVHVFKKTGDTWYAETQGRIGSFPHKAFKYEKTSSKSSRPDFRDWKQRSISHLTGKSKPGPPRLRTPRDLETFFSAAGMDATGVGTKTIPRGFEPGQAEIYLEDSEFQLLMGCTKGEYVRLPTWKKDQLKAKAGIGGSSSSSSGSTQS